MGWKWCFDGAMKREWAIEKKESVIQGPPFIDNSEKTTKVKLNICISYAMITVACVCVCVCLFRFLK